MSTEPVLTSVQAPRAARAAGSPTLTFSGGGWLIALTVAVLSVLVTWAMWGVMTGNRPVGDGTTVSSYGFQLTPMRADSAFLVASGLPRDFLHTLDQPGAMRGADMLEYNNNARRNYVVTTDRVIGVTVNGESRAYPLAVMNAHEVVNDTLGGVPIAVSYSPLTDSAVVFDRRVEGRQRLFKVSGLLYNSNLVMYDVPEQPDANWVPSLWSQLGMRAIAGPAAAADAKIVPLSGVNIASWKMWLHANPTTSVILPDPDSKQRYKEFSYARYYLTPRVDYPVMDLQPESPESTTPDSAIASAERGDSPSRKSAAVTVSAGGEEAVWTLAQLLTRTGGADGVWNTQVGGVPITVVTQQHPLAAMVYAANGEPISVIPQLWFAQRAFAAERASSAARVPKN